MGILRTWRRIGAIGLVAVALGATACEPAPDTFTPTTDMRSARVGHTATTLASGRVLVVGGAAPGRPSVERYDPASGQWVARSSLETNRSGHEATRLASGDVLVTGGNLVADSGPTCGSERYVVAEDRWRCVAAPPVDGPHALALLPSGQVLAVFANDASVGWLYDPGADRWTEIADQKETRSWQTVTVLPGGRVLVVGGDTVRATDGQRGFTRAERFDPGTGRWASTGSVPGSTVELAALTGGKVIALGAGLLRPGSPFETPTAVAVYAASAGTWQESEDATGCNNSPLSDLTLTGLGDGSALVLGRHSCVSSTYSLAVRVRPGSTSDGLGAAERAGHAVAVLDDGRALVTGGAFGQQDQSDPNCCRPFEPRATAELFNP